MSSSSPQATCPTTACAVEQPGKRFRYSDWLWVIMFVVMIGGWFYPYIGLAVAVCFAGAVFSAILYGRKWCGTLCPRGNFWDRIMKRIVRKPRMPAWAKNPVVRVTVLVVLMGAMITQLVLAWGDWEAVGRVFVVLLTVTTAIGFAFGLATHQRVWCAVCPAGTMASWIGRNKPPHLLLDEDRCKSCNLCCRECPMDLKPVQMAAEGPRTHPDCLKCSACVNTCPVNALTLTGDLKSAPQHSTDEEAAA